MMKQISPRDWETLSAYLDGQLTSRERARLEARLQKEPGLRAALTELGRTRHVLRSLPRLRAPRNFTLTPEMAGQRRRSIAGLYPTFRFASAMASLLFVLVLVGDFLGFGGGAFAPGRNMAALQMEVALQEKEAYPSMEAVEAPAAEVAEEEVPLEAPAPEAFALEVITTTEAAEVELQAASDMEEAAVAVVAESGAAGIEPTVMAEGEASAESMESPLPSEKTGDEDTRSARSETKEPQAETPPLGALRETPEMIESVDIQELETASPDRGPEPSGGLPLIRVLEVLLGGVAIGCGMAAFYLRRREEI